MFAVRLSHPSWSLAWVLRSSGLLAVVLLSSCLRLNEPDEYSCHDDSDCEDHEKCLGTLETRTPRCVPEDHYSQPADCLDPEVCIGGTCTVPECQGGGFDANCAPYTCDYYTYTCNTECFSQASCAEGYLCSEGACVPQECHEGDQSTCAPYRCQGGLCGTSCTDSDQCFRYHECKDQQCVPMLRVDGEPCSAGSECASELCCATGFQGVYECATECTYLAAGETCNWSAACCARRTA